MKNKLQKDRSTSYKKKCKLMVYNDLKNGLQPTEIKKKYSFSNRMLSYYLAPYKQTGELKKIGYGVWKFKPLKELTLSPALATSHPQFNSKNIRGHAFSFKVLFKGLNWKNILKRNNIEPQFLSQNKVYQFIYMGRKVWLSSSGLRIYWAKGESIFANGSYEARKIAINDFHKCFKQLFFLLNINPEIKGLEVSKQHYSRVHSTLARMLEERGEKLSVKDPVDGRVWMLIDNSFNLHETEHIHKDRAHDDSEGWQRFANDLRDNGFPTFSEM
jgi:hypothetical protein